MNERPIGTSATGERRTMRADARRNRERVLAAAREAFAAEGIAVPLDEIARRAGVGPGTVYRHFPTKEALFHAAIVDNIERMTERAHALSTAPDAAAAFFEFLDLMVLEGGVKRDLAEALGGQEPAEFSGPRQQLRSGIDTLLRRAQTAGAVRSDIDIDDLLRLLKGAFVAAYGGPDEIRRQRTFDVVFDGLRARCAEATVRTR